ncbi:Polyamine aminopropyltransferase [Seminavis robusta]|uniref:Polyamine aminopropyltransferase n=1 Tax=Seminavis robusta TaxID=568900 RepID=A0A9N8D5P7_9STRA|nr:Polyamine aminopropyltransferase [Seminavis robusta]|eukprot:Sro6_g005550.1 Polyamine aminopropyltransferase (721) ;mRNA; r:236682-238844
MAKAASNTKDDHQEEEEQRQRQQRQPNPYQIPLSGRFLVLSFVSAVVTCFALGALARRILLLQHHQGRLVEGGLSTSASASSGQEQNSLPPLFVAPHKTFPHTRYTSKHYDTGLSVSSNTLLSHRQKTSTTTGSTPNTTTTTSSNNSNTSPPAEQQQQQEEEVHEPAGQHLLIDIEHVDGAFLNSEHHLAQAMIDLVEQSGLTMLSYHCHKLLPAGISCAGVLLESHVSFHTWPVQGVITLDLFTCGPNSLLNLLDDVNSLFAIPSTTATTSVTTKQPNTVWAWKRRGFPTDDGYTPGISDLGTTLLGVLQFPQKNQVSFVQTPFQTVHIYNVLDPRYSHTHAETRMYLDGVLQSRERGQAANAEALIHPALLTHPNPTTVTLIGGGDGGSLREILKHKSVQQVEWAEIDKAVVEISQKYLWSQCHDFLFDQQESSNSCRDDPRVNLYYEDGFKWFQKRYANNNETTSGVVAPAPRQDVIVLDVLNPEDDVDFSEVFFDDVHFAQVCFDALQDDGILAVPLGGGRSINDPPELLTRARRVAKLVANLEGVGFAAIHEYEDSHTGKLEIDTHSFLVAFKDVNARREWFQNEAQVQVKLQQRLMTPLKYFDGAVMQSYQMPSRASQVMYCRNNPDASDCHLPNEVELCDDPLPALSKTTAATVAQQQGIQLTDVYNPFRIRNAWLCPQKEEEEFTTTTTTNHTTTLEEGECVAGEGQECMAV